MAPALLDAWGCRFPIYGEAPNAKRVLGALRNAEIRTPPRFLLGQSTRVSRHGVEENHSFNESGISRETSKFRYRPFRCYPSFPEC